jgi:hypothetical protein
MGKENSKKETSPVVGDILTRYLDNTMINPSCFARLQRDLELRKMWLKVIKVERLRLTAEALIIDNTNFRAFESVINNVFSADFAYEILKYVEEGKKLVASKYLYEILQDMQSWIDTPNLERGGH